MNHGRIEQTGTPNEVFQHPANEFVIDFLGNVNLFHGRVRRRQGRVRLAGARPSRGRRRQRAARLFVRPHELDIQTVRNGQPALPAKVQRILATGPMVKVELQRRGRRVDQRRNAARPLPRDPHRRRRPRLRQPARRQGVRRGLLDLEWGRGADFSREWSDSIQTGLWREVLVVSEADRRRRLCDRTVLPSLCSIFLRSCSGCPPP